MYKYPLVTVITLIMLSPGLPAGAADQSLDEIRNTAIELVRSRLNAADADMEISARPLDQRLRLAPCSAPLQAFVPNSRELTANSLIGVRCNDSRPWSIYVSVTIRIYRDVATATRSLPQNHILTGQDIVLQRQDINRFSGAYLSVPEALIGKQLKRPVQLGKPILTHMLKNPRLIQRGQLVTLLARNSSVEVRMEGKALMDGAAGERIRVTNLRSNRVLEGVLIEDGTVLVN